MNARIPALVRRLVDLVPMASRPPNPSEKLMRRAADAAGIEYKPPPRRIPTTRAELMAERAKALSVKLEELARQLRANPSAEEAARLEERVWLIWGAAAGSSDPKRKRLSREVIARMKLLEAIHLAAEEQRAGRDAAEALGRPNLAADSVGIFRTMTMAYLNGDLGDPAIQEAIDGWEARGSSDGKWKTLVAFLHASGLGMVSPERLKKDWSAWRKSG